MSGSQVFISYRRGPSSTPYARGIYERASERLGAGRVFMDLDSIDPGIDFVDYIEDAIESCAVLIAVIGPGWLTVEDTPGERRLDNPDDFVRAEIAAALKRKDVRVIPVLVGDATMPRRTDLPEPLAPLARRNALELSDARWPYDLGRLLDVIEKAVPPSPAPAAAPKPQRAKPQPRKRPAPAPEPPPLRPTAPAAQHDEMLAAWERATGGSRDEVLFFAMGAFTSPATEEKAARAPQVKDLGAATISQRISQWFAKETGADPRPPPSLPTPLSPRYAGHVIFVRGRNKRPSGAQLVAYEAQDTYDLAKGGDVRHEVLLKSAGQANSPRGRGVKWPVELLVPNANVVLTFRSRDAREDFLQVLKWAGVPVRTA